MAATIPPTGLRARIARPAAALAGPALIVASTLVILRDHLFRGLAYAGDVMTLWLPTYCFLGRSLGEGHVPAWNPHMMAGVPFAADPQSGWMNVSAMALFGVLPCGVAIQAMIALQPILAGLGLLAFLRSERLSRAAAALGGTALALAVAGSALAVSLPFSAALAWTAVMLAAASRMVRARVAWKSLLWGLAAAVAWGQVAAALLTDGLVIGSAALLAYAGATLIGGRDRAGEGGRAATALLRRWGTLLLVLVPVNAAYLLPRLAYAPRTSLGRGYAELDRIGAALSGKADVSSSLGAAGATWPLNLALSPGLYLGAAVLVLAFAAFWSSRHRRLALAFGLFGLLFYLLSLQPVADWIRDTFGSSRPVDVYLHAPGRMGLALVPAVAVLAGIGLDAWRERRGWSARAAMLVPGVAVWGIAPTILGAEAGWLALFAAGTALGLGALAGAAWGTRRVAPIFLAVLPVLLAAEVSLNALGSPDPDESEVVGFAPRPPNVAALPAPTGSLERYLDGGGIAQVLRRSGPSRYLSVGRRHRQEEAQALGLGIFNEAAVLEVENAGGYNAVQLHRYWTFVRASERRRLVYSRGMFERAPPVALDLLAVRHVLAERNAPTDPGLPPGARAVAEEGGWILYELPDPATRASVVTAWSVVEGPQASLQRIAHPAFDPRREAVVEGDPGPAPTPAGNAAPGLAAYLHRGPQAARVLVDAPAGGLLVVRNAFDAGWHASLDGRPVTIHPTDHVVQGIAVPPGRHVVDLAYDNPWIGRGLLVSGAAWMMVLAAVWSLRRRATRTGDDELQETRAVADSEAPGVGLEPTTLGLTGPCSAD